MTTRSTTSIQKSRLKRITALLGLIGTTHGIYIENLNGTGLATIADNAGSFIVHPGSIDPITDFFDPAISNGVVAFVGKAADGLAQGIYTFPATGAVLKDGSPAFTQLLSSIGKLPGDPNGGDNFINILTPTLQLVGHQLTFVATNALSNPTYAGIFAVDTVTGVVTKIVSTADSLTGLGTLLAEFSYSVNEAGQLVFKATDGINAGYFLANIVGGVSQITQIVLSGQTINVSGHDVTVLLSDIIDLGKYQLNGLNFVFQIISDSEEIVIGLLQGLLPTPTPTATATGTPAGTPTATRSHSNGNTYRYRNDCRDGSVYNHSRPRLSISRRPRQLRLNPRPRRVDRTLDAHPDCDGRRPSPLTSYRNRDATAKTAQLLRPRHRLRLRRRR